MHTREILTCLCDKYTLGKIICDPVAVTGGLLHRMYHVTTDQGEYAIKLLNPDIMKRPKAMSNMIHSERIAAHIAAYFAHSAEDLSAENSVPVVAALEYSGQHLLSTCPLDFGKDSLTDTDPPQYALAYPWLDARSLFVPEIGAGHCRKVGHLLGQIHHADFRIDEVEPETSTRSPYDWQGYLAMAREQKVSWLADYEAMLPDLFRWDQAAVDAMETVNAFQVITHRDLDPKNILWQGTNPLIIDWEAAGYVNPYQELLEVMNYWCRDKEGSYSTTLCHALLQEYIQFMDLQNADWEPVFACSYDSMLGWLEYTLKKGLGLEGNEADRSQGAQQLLDAYRELKRYDDQAWQLRTMLAKAGQKK